MKIWVQKTTDTFNEGEIRIYESLESCCIHLIETEDFNGFYPGVIVSKPDAESPLDEIQKECDWVVEIYNDYRE